MLKPAKNFEKSENWLGKITKCPWIPANKGEAGGLVIPGLTDSLE